MLLVGDIVLLLNLFAIQKELFGFHPWIGHLTNILSYALLMVILFLTIKALLSFPPFNKENAKFNCFFSNSAISFSSHSY